MSLSRVFPRLFAFCFALSLLALNVRAQQTSAARPRQAAQPTTTTETNGRTKLENDITPAPDEDADNVDDSEMSAEGFVLPSKIGLIERQMLAAIEERLGTPYRMGATGPNRFDCSGFVWSVFQQAGVGFERSSARSLWQEFAPPSEDEKFKFGTLVFFNNLHHIGIVADENGFFHASSSHGVMYSRFGDYWTKRISGFRRIPLAQGQSFIASSGR
jgi:cell wall-associated NlpC family hydrolase